MIVGWPTAFKGPAKPAGAAVVAAAFRRAGEKDSCAVSVSTDRGHSWKPVWKAEGAGELRAVADLSEHVAGRYEYLFVVDGQWLPDPNARESVQNPYGGTNSVLTVSE